MPTNYYDPNTLTFIQSRAESDPALVEEYAAMMSEGVGFDPASAVTDGTHIYVWDGYHRGAAAKQMGKLLFVSVRPGSREEAEWLALSANQKHGLRRSQADKRRVVELALLHVNGAQLSDRQIGAHCGVHHDTVGRIRKEIEATGGIRQSDTRIGADGRTINTAKIGSNQPVKPKLLYCKNYLCSACRENRASVQPDSLICDYCGSRHQLDQNGQAQLAGGEKERQIEAHREFMGALRRPVSPLQQSSTDAYKIPTIGPASIPSTDWKCENCARRIPAGTAATVVEVNSQDWKICPACLPDFRKRAGERGRYNSPLPLRSPADGSLELTTSFICPRCGGRTGRVNGGAICLSEACGARWETRAEYESELDAYLDDIDAPPLQIEPERAEALRQINMILARLPVDKLSQATVMLREWSESSC